MHEAIFWIDLKKLNEWERVEFIKFRRNESVDCCFKAREIKEATYATLKVIIKTLRLIDLIYSDKERHTSNSIFYLDFIHVWELLWLTYLI